MSWDGLIFNGIDVPKSLDNLGNDWRPLSLGSSAEVIKKLSRFKGRIVWDSSEYGSMVTQDYVIEFNINSEKDSLDCIGVRILGEGNPFKFLRKVCKKYNWGLYDCQSGDLVDFDNSNIASWDAFLELVSKSC
jgi:hypothetical protein